MNKSILASILLIAISSINFVVTSSEEKLAKYFTDVNFDSYDINFLDAYRTELSLEDAFKAMHSLQDNQSHLLHKDFKVFESKYDRDVYLGVDDHDDFDFEETLSSEVLLQGIVNRCSYIHSHDKVDFTDFKDSVATSVLHENYKTQRKSNKALQKSPFVELTQQGKLVDISTDLSKWAAEIEQLKFVSPKKICKNLSCDKNNVMSRVQLEISLDSSVSSNSAIQLNDSGEACQQDEEQNDATANLEDVSIVTLTKKQLQRARKAEKEEAARLKEIREQEYLNDLYHIEKPKRDAEAAQIRLLRQKKRAEKLKKEAEEASRPSLKKLFPPLTQDEFHLPLVLTLVRVTTMLYENVLNDDDLVPVGCSQSDIACRQLQKYIADGGVVSENIRKLVKLFYSESLERIKIEADDNGTHGLYAQHASLKAREMLKLIK